MMAQLAIAGCRVQVERVDERLGKLINLISIFSQFSQPMGNEPLVNICFACYLFNTFHSTMEPRRCGSHQLEMKSQYVLDLSPLHNISHDASRLNVRYYIMCPRLNESCRNGRLYVAFAVQQDEARVLCGLLNGQRTSERLMFVSINQLSINTWINQK